MSEEIWDAMKYIREEQRSRNRQAKHDNTEYLKCVGVPFESKNDGHHIILDCNPIKIDFWPSTSRWKVRGGQTGFGVRTLVEFIDGRG